MTPERWQEIESLLDKLLDLPADERAAFLDQASAGNAALRDDVARLLKAHNDADIGPLGVAGDQAAAAWAAPLLAQIAATRSTSDQVNPGTTAVPGGNAITTRPERIGPWRLGAPAGRGGMGDVYVAERDDGAFRMRVALKLVRAGLQHHGSFVQRFAAERQILAQLNHPGIARLLDGGITETGVPWYAMEYVEGAAIDAWCATHAPQLEQRLALFARVCDAVTVAHAMSVVHRDIKPSNILVTDDGQPKLLDFGIAKALTDDAETEEHAAARDDAPARSPKGYDSVDWRNSARSNTGTGQRLLTPAYASPEQLTGGAVSPATDVWALGVVLYQLLTGSHPFERGDVGLSNVERRIVEDELTAPSAVLHTSAARAWTRAVRGDLDAIVLKALARDPKDRYANAAELAEDVRNHLASRPVRARRNDRGAWWYRGRLMIRRHRTASTAALFGMMAGVGALVAWRGENAFRDELHPVRGAAQHAGTESLRAMGYYEDGLRAWGNGSWADAGRFLGQALREDSTFALAALFAADAASRDGDDATARRELLRAQHLAGDEHTKVGLLVRTYLALREQSPALAVLADSLTELAPESEAGRFFAAHALEARGAYVAAATQFHDLASSSSAPSGAVEANATAACWRCAAWERSVHAWMLADSLTAAARAAEQAVQQYPNVPLAWRALARVHLLQGGHDTTAFRRLTALDPAAVDERAVWIATAALKQGAFDRAEAVLRARLLGGGPVREDHALGALVAVLREQGRWPEALEVARRFRAVAWVDTASPTKRPGGAPSTALLEAQVLLESGRAQDAAALLDSIVLGLNGETMATRATDAPAQLATALAVLGDTSRLARVSDTLAQTAVARGTRVARLHAAYARGLLLLARGQPAAAADTLALAIGSPNLGYTRANIARAEALLRLQLGADAVAALQPALRGAIDGENTYSTEAEVHTMLARAWRLVGNADSATAHERWVARARGRSAAPRVLVPGR